MNWEYSVTACDKPADLIGYAGAHGVVFSHDGVGIAGRGPFHHIPVDQAIDTLSRFRPIGPVPNGAPLPRGVGARPFDPNSDWSVVVPSHQIIVDAGGNAWELTLETDNESVPEDEPVATPTPADRPVAVTPIDDPQVWGASVATATQRIAQGHVEKVVLARAVAVQAPTAFVIPVILQRLTDANPSCYVFHVDGLVGASPELLVARSGDRVFAQPMAGTTRRDPDPARDEALAQALFASASYRHEHQVTIDMVHDTLLNFASYVDYEPEPALVKLANVTHLASRVEGQLSTPPASVLDLIDALHPTPAVSGRPLAAALAVINELETHNRNRYAGTVGWVDGSGDGEWAVTIRCAQLDPDVPGRAVVHAGCGIVADSDPTAELAESEAKLQAALSALLD